MPIDEGDSASREEAGINDEPEEFVDLSGEEATSKEEYKPNTEPYEPTRDREKVRGKIAIWLLTLLILMVVFSFVSIAFKWMDIPTLKSLVEIFFTPLIGLVSAVTGFYYGEKAR